LNEKRQTAKARADGRNGERESGRRAADCPTVMVSWVVTAAPAGVTVVGLNEHVVPAGNPEQAKLTAELKPLVGVTVIVIAPEPPGFRLRTPGLAVSVIPGEPGKSMM